MKHFFPGIKMITVSVLMTACMVQAKSQETETENRKGIRLSNIALCASVSGNAFGLHYSPIASFSTGGRMAIGAGPVFKADKPHYAGYVVKARYELMNHLDSYSGRTHLYLYGSFERNNRQYFSNGWNEIEILTSRTNYGSEFSFRDVRFKGFEASAGFGVGHMFSKTFSLNMEIGLSGYKTTRLNYESIRLYYQPKGMCLHMALSARFNLNRN